MIFSSRHCHPPSYFRNHVRVTQKCVFTDKRSLGRFRIANAPCNFGTLIFRSRTDFFLGTLENLVLQFRQISIARRRRFNLTWKFLETRWKKEYVTEEHSLCTRRSLKFFKSDSGSTKYNLNLRMWGNTFQKWSVTRPFEKLVHSRFSFSRRSEHTQHHLPRCLHPLPFLLSNRIEQILCNLVFYFEVWLSLQISNVCGNIVISPWKNSLR